MTIYLSSSYAIFAGILRAIILVKRVSSMAEQIRTALVTRQAHFRASSHNPPLRLAHGVIGDTLEPSDVAGTVTPPGGCYVRYCGLYRKETGTTPSHRRA